MDQLDLMIIQEYIKERQPVIDKQLEAEKYYDNKAVEPGKGINHDFFSLLVDEKINYLLGKEPTLSCDNQAYLDKAKEILGSELLSDLQDVAREASVKNIAWWQAYINEDGKLNFMLIPSEEIIPVWTDKSHKKLQTVIRRYPVEEYKGTSKEIIWKVEVYDDQYAYFYEERGGNLILDSEKYLNAKEGEEISHFYINNQGYGMGRPPFAFLKNNSREKSDLQKVKDLIDAYNGNRTRMDQMLEDFKNWIAVIKNYSGDEENKKVFKKMVDGRYIFVDGDGGVDVVTPNIDTTANDSHNQTLKDDMILFGQSVDRNKMTTGNAASGVALKMLYAGLDLKCNGLEREINKFFNQVEYFMKSYLALVNTKVADEDIIEIIFNRDIAMNEAEAIEMCKNSVCVISGKTIVENHPWVKDADEELKQIQKEQSQEFEYEKQRQKEGDDNE